jgi:hypothetical protein
MRSNVGVADPRLSPGRKRMYLFHGTRAMDSTANAVPGTLYGSSRFAAPVGCAFRAANYI